MTKLRRKSNGQIVEIDDQGNEQPVQIEELAAEADGMIEVLHQ